MFFRKVLLGCWLGTLLSMSTVHAVETTVADANFDGITDYTNPTTAAILDTGTTTGSWDVSYSDTDGDGSFKPVAYAGSGNFLFLDSTGPNANFNATATLNMAETTIQDGGLVVSFDANISRLNHTGSGYASISGFGGASGSDPLFKIIFRISATDRGQIGYQDASDAYQSTGLYVPYLSATTTPADFSNFTSFELTLDASNFDLLISNGYNGSEGTAQPDLTLSGLEYNSATPATTLSKVVFSVYTATDTPVSGARFDNVLVRSGVEKIVIPNVLDDDFSNVSDISATPGSWETPTTVTFADKDAVSHDWEFVKASTVDAGIINGSKELRIQVNAGNYSTTTTAPAEYTYFAVDMGKSVEGGTVSFSYDYVEVAGSTWLDIQYSNETSPAKDVEEHWVSVDTFMISGHDGTNSGSRSYDFSSDMRWFRIRLWGNGPGGDNDYIAFDNLKVIGNDGVTPPVAPALKGNGTSSLTVTGYKGVGGANPRTIEMWVNIPADQKGKRLFGSGVNASGQRVDFYSDGTTGQLRFEINGGAWLTDSVITDGAWHHIAVAVDNATTIRMYIDGNEETLTGGGTINTDNVTSDLKLFDTATATSGPITATVDEFRYWSTALTEVQIEVAYKRALKSGTGGSVLTNDDVTVTGLNWSDLQVYYKFDYLSYPGFDSSSYARTATETPSIWAVGSTVESGVNHLLTLTPAIGLEVVQDGTELTWTVEDEVGVKEYHIVNVTTGEVLETIIADGSDQYKTTLMEGETAKLVVVDSSGFKQTFMPVNGNFETVTYDFVEGWNLIAITGDNADFSAVNSALWSWNGTSYEKIINPRPTQAVWVYAQEKVQVNVVTEKSDAKIELETGWNMVGPVENVKVPAGAHTVYSWNGTYDVIANEQDTLVRGVGYWIFAL